MSVFMILHKDVDTQIRPIPFVCKDGNTTLLVEMIGDYLYKAGMAPCLHETIADERFGVILQLRCRIKELEKEVARLEQSSRDAHDLWTPIFEAAK